MPERSSPSALQQLVTWSALGVLVALAWVLRDLDWAGLRALRANGQGFRLATDLTQAAWLPLTVGALAGAGLGLVLRGRASVPTALGRPLVLLGGLALLACTLAGLRARSRPVAEGPNVLLMVLDTTRRDRFSVYGYERATTPRIDALAEEGVTYTDAYSVSSWTSPSHASMFTGLYPVAHGVTQEAWSLGQGQLTLAEVLWEEGYRTLGSVGNPMVGTHLGFEQGFEAYHEDWRDEDWRDDEGRDPREHPALRNLERLARAPSERPFFAFINFIEVHSPYLSGPHRRMFDRHPEANLANNSWRAYFKGKLTFSPAELEHLSDLYDGELRYADDLVGAALDILDEEALLDDTVVVVTSDHGEHFGAHGLIDHVFNLYEGNVAIPLILRYPPAFEAGARLAAPVQLQDLYPTLLGLAGASHWARQHQGQDLVQGEGPATDRVRLLSYAYPEQALEACGDERDLPALEPHKKRLFAVRRGPWKLIRSERPLDEARTRWAVESEELYDLDSDPEELIDLAQSPQGAALLEDLRADLEAQLEAHARSGVGTAAGALDDQTHAQLQNLGYVEGSSSAEPEPELEPELDDGDGPTH